MNSGINYKSFYNVLLNLREIFHSYGRLDDSNMKLDEIVKLIMLSYSLATKSIRFSLSFVKENAKKIYNNENDIAASLRELFGSVSKEPLFLNSDGTSIFGSNPTLNIQPSENAFAEKLILEIEKIDFINLIQQKNNTDFDILNECFGHFVRDNFRNNKEDAQYMTPAEISGAIATMVFEDFKKENYFSSINPESFTIMDPTCGVSTLLIESAKEYIKILENSEFNNKDTLISKFLTSNVIGQDKVDRMVRLSKINCLLLGINTQNIYIGNSISEHSNIDCFKGKVDFIFTNPPFGAEYHTKDLIINDFEYIDVIKKAYSQTTSEILMLLKCLALLKDNGKLAIVLPDSVFSARGINADIREYILSNFTINAIIEMPAVTFAQAGTRTKTSILYLTKRKPETNHRIIMAVCDDIGYVVKERTGVPIKISNGANQMPSIAAVYNEHKFDSSNILSNSPSITAISYDELNNNVLNPTFYNATRLGTLKILSENKLEGFEIHPLSDLVKVETIGRKSFLTSDNVKHVSVLHINADMTINFSEVEQFVPTSKGRLCKEGDILFSKINPRIPRMTVVPAYNKTLVCSNEFEIMRPSTDIGAYVICLLLKTSYVYKQIENLTSGTSSSHSRIKREDLCKIKVPFPISTEAKNLFIEINADMNKFFEIKYSADEIMNKNLKKLEAIL